MANSSPRATLGDHVHLLARAGISSIPVIGGPALELFNYLLAPPIQRRRDEWLNELEERLSKFEQEGRVNLEALRDNEEFISTVMQASAIAIRNHEQEKIEALRNAVVNTAVGQSPENSKRELFLNFVDSFTVPHLRVLKALFQGDQVVPRNVPVKTAITEITELAVRLVPAMGAQPELAEVIVEDVCRKGLLFWNRRPGTAIYVQSDATQVSPLGREFLRFLSEPSDLTESADDR